MRGPFAAFLVLFALVAAPASAQLAFDRQVSKDQPVNIKADSLEYERTRDVFIARGNVKITHEYRYLTADWVAFGNTSRHAVAAGNVVLADGTDTLYAEFIEFNIDSLQGVVYDGTLLASSTGFRMEGAELRKTGDETFELKEGRFTTCQCPEEGRDPWALTAKEAQVDANGYAVVKNSTVEILGVPLFWVPWAAYPVKQERKSGLLLPEFSASGRNGMEIGVPFYWAARHNVNVIARPTWMSDRGLMPELELEYVFGERSEGEAFASFILGDHKVDPDDPKTPYSDDRWGVIVDHDQFLPWNSRLKVDAQVVSDNAYVSDFSEFGQWRRDRYMTSTAFLTKQFSPSNPFGAFAAVRWADDLQNPDDQDRDPFLLQRLPELAGSQTSARLPSFLDRFVTSFDVDYTYFWRQKQPSDVYPQGLVLGPGDGTFMDTGIDAIPDGNERNNAGTIVPGDANMDDAPGGPEMDLLFEEGEALADKGQRVMFNPRVALPMQLGGVVELFPEVGYHGTLYYTDNLNSTTRHLVTGQVDLRTRLRRTFDLPFGVGAGTHVFEPRVRYQIINGVNQNNNPLFIPRTAVTQTRIRQLTIENVLRDPADRIPEVNRVSLGMGNRIYTRTVPSLESLSEAQREKLAGRDVSTLGVERLYADIDLSVDYDIAESQMGFLVTEGSVYPTSWSRLGFNFGFDLDETRVSEGFIEYALTHERGHDLRFRYRYIRDIPRFFEDFQFEKDRFDQFEAGQNRVNEISIAGRWRATERWAVTGDFRYSIEGSLLLTSRGGLEYLSACKCWAIRGLVDWDRQRGASVNVEYTLLGIGDDTTRPFQNRRFKLF